MSMEMFVMSICYIAKIKECRRESKPTSLSFRKCETRLARMASRGALIKSTWPGRRILVHMYAS